MITSGLVEQRICGPDSNLHNNSSCNSTNSDGDICDQPPLKLALRMNTSDSVDGSYFDSTIETFSTRVNDNESVKHTKVPSTTSHYVDDVGATEPHAESPCLTSLNHTNGQACHASNEKMSRTNLYIKGLPDTFNDDKLWNLAPLAAHIKSVKAATDDDGKCRGYGFIDFVSEEAANEALRHIRDACPAFTIKFAKENEKDKTNLYVTNLPKSWTTKDSDQLKTVFERFGMIQSAFVMVERSTNRTTGVGFVRYASERDALNALDSIKKNPLILPECTSPVEAKFADKHNPETRRRRYPINNLLNSTNVNSLIGYPMSLCNGSNSGNQDTLTALLNAGIPLHTPNPAHNSLIHIQPHKNEYVHRIAQGLYSSTFPAKLPQTACTTSMGTSDYGVASGTAAETQLEALAAVAASALLGGNQSSGFVNPCLRTTHPCGIPSGLNGSLVSTNPLSLLNPSPLSPVDNALLDPSGLYRCSVYGNDFFRQSQQHQQQQLLNAAMAALNNTHSSNTVYASIPDLASYLGYTNLLTPPQASNLNGNHCISANGSAMPPIFANPVHGLITANSLMNSATAAPLSPDSIGLFTSRSNNMMPQWVIPSQLIKGATNEAAVGLTHSTMHPNSEM